MMSQFQDMVAIIGSIEESEEAGGEDRLDGCLIVMLSIGTVSGTETVTPSRGARVLLH